MDVDSLPPGADFLSVINETVGQSDVVLALIGPSWLDARDAEGRRRLDDPSDYVRLEVATALARQIRVVPILVGGAAMPPATALPPDLAGLAGKHAFAISDDSWRTRVVQLTRTLEYGEASLEAAPASWRRRLRGKPARLAACAVVVLVGVGVGLSRLLASGPTAPRVPGSGGVAAVMPKDIDSTRDCRTFPPPTTVLLAKTELICSTADLPGAQVVGYGYPDFASFRQGFVDLSDYLGVSVTQGANFCPPPSNGPGIVFSALDELTECWTAGSGATLTENLLWTVPQGDAILGLVGGPSITWTEVYGWYERYVAPGEPHSPRCIRCAAAPGPLDPLWAKPTTPRLVPTTFYRWVPGQETSGASHSPPPTTVVRLPTT
jgi:hypothetical protein